MLWGSKWLLGEILNQFWLYQNMEITKGEVSHLFRHCEYSVCKRRAEPCARKLGAIEHQ